LKGTEKPNRGKKGKQRDNKGGFYMIDRDGDYASQREDRLFEQFPAVLTPLEVMDILGVGKNTVYRLLNSGELQGFRVGRSWRVSEDMLKEFMNTFS